MKQDRPHLIASEENNSLPILIIDKKGIIGTALANKLKDQFLVVLVSGKQLEFHNNIVHIPYRKKIPVIPDNSYSHIFVFYHGEEEILEILLPLIKKANETAARLFFFASLINSSEQLFRRLSNHAYHRTKVVLYGEVFDEKIQNPNMVNLFIHQARTYGRVVIPNEGIGKLYPIYLEDLLIVIVAASFSMEAKGGNLFVFPRHPFTEITVARVFQKINPDLKIDFSKRRIRNYNYYIPAVGDYAFTNYNLEEGLKKINISSSNTASFAPEKSISLPRQKINYNKKFFLLLLVALLLLPILFVLLTAGAGASFVSQSIKQAEKGNFQSASRLGTYGSVAFNAASAIGGAYLPGEIIAKEAKDKFVGNLRTGKEVADIESDLFKSASTFSDIYKNKGANISKEDFVRALANIKNNLLKIDQMKAQDQLPKDFQDKLNKESYMLTTLENTIDSLPQILGFVGKKQYLVLFQNNMELRPGGGFIGSYAILAVEKGRIEKFEIHDVYDADGKLKTHIEPPYGLRRYGGVSHWFLRDSNFDVDFTTNAAAAADILKRETNERVDGVIALDTNFIKNILESVGPVEVVDYKEQVSAANFYLLTQKHAEDNFFAGSTQKKDFLRSLMSSMLSSFSANKDISYIDLSKQVEKSLKEKHILFAFASPALQKVFTVNSLSGALYDARAKKENSIQDFLGTSDANIGANKDNYYLKRSISQNTTITESGGVTEEVAINYINTSTKGSVFGGDYKNYLRFILPKGSELKSIKIDGQDKAFIVAVTNPSQFGASGYVPPQELEVETTEAGGKEVIAFLLMVPQLTSRQVTISYTIPESVNLNNPSFSYDLRVTKQPGTDTDPYAFSLSYPSRFKPIGLGKDIVDLGGKVTHETNLSEDRNIRINFSQK